MVKAAKKEAEVLTIGHSTLPFAVFVSYLQKAYVTAIADVRTSPFSRRFPQFNKTNLQAELKYSNIKYVFLGKELGGRPSSEAFYRNGIADYEKMAQDPIFLHGIGRVIKGMEEHQIALMCSEHNPLDCHRCLLVSRVLAERGVEFAHILHDGKIAAHSDIEEKLLRAEGHNSEDLFSSRQERLAKAYKRRAEKVAYSGPRMTQDN